MFTHHSKQALFFLLSLLFSLVHLQASQSYILTPNNLRKLYNKKYPGHKIEQDVLFGRCEEIREVLKDALLIKNNSIEETLRQAGFIKTNQLNIQTPQYILHEPLTKSTLHENLSTRFHKLLAEHLLNNLERYAQQDKFQTALQINITREGAFCTCAFFSSEEHTSQTILQQIKKKVSTILAKLAPQDQSIKLNKMQLATLFFALQIIASGSEYTETINPYTCLAEHPETAIFNDVYMDDEADYCLAQAPMCPIFSCNNLPDIPNNIASMENLIHEDALTIHTIAYILDVVNKLCSGHTPCIISYFRSFLDCHNFGKFNEALDIHFNGL